MRGASGIESCGISDVGMRRQSNEDRLVIDEEVGLYLVADGMGGHNAGEIASRLAAETVSTFIRRSREEEEITWPYGYYPKLSYEANRLRTAIMLANKRIWREADNRQELMGMGTTIVAALVSADRITFAGAGDSRVYRIRDGKLEQMTTDDSWVQVAIDEGVLEPDEAESHPMRNIITKALGAKENIDVTVQEDEIREADQYLLCSDGLHGMVGDPEILKIVLDCGRELEACVSRLVQAANDHGGKDNITVLLLRHRAP